MSPTTIDPPDVQAASQRYFAAWTARDPHRIAALHTQDTVFWMHLGTAPVAGRDSVLAAIVEIFARFPDFSFETNRVRYGDDHWVLDWTLCSGDVRFDCLDIVEVSPEGLVARKDTFVDAAQLQAALGRGPR